MNVRQNTIGLRIIGIMKLLSAALLLATAVGIFRLMGADTGDMLEHFVHRLHMDPENKYVIKVLSGISGLSRKQLRAIDAGTFIYGLLYITEGIGLLLARHWAEYLTVIATASLIPIEIYEIAKKPGAMRIAVLLVNLAIVAYVVYRLRADRRADEG